MQDRSERRAGRCAASSSGSASSSALVGLTALAVAGIGVGNGVASYLDAQARRHRDAEGARRLARATIAAIYLIQIGAGRGGRRSSPGWLLGAAVPAIVAAVAGRCAAGAAARSASIRCRC